MVIAAAGDTGGTGGGEPSEEEEQAGVDVFNVAHVVVDVDSFAAVAASTADRHRLPAEGEGRPATGCRICHLGGSDGDDDDGGGEMLAESGSGRLVRLGCGCRGELAAAHRRCAEAWFSVRGNRRCEICGETAENISSWGGGGKEFMQRWHETSGMDGQGSSKAFCKSHSFCNLLIACFIIVFVLPWFLHIHVI